MKILCVADHIDPLIYSSSVKQRFSDIDLVLAAGDLPLSYYDFIVSSLNKPLLFIFGNHHLTKLEHYRRSGSSRNLSEVNQFAKQLGNGATYIGGKIVKSKNLLIGGLGGCMKYNNGPNQFTDFGMRLYMLRLLPALLFNRIFRGRFIDILLTHAPPENPEANRDFCHRGFAAFHTFMKRFKPKYLIHGHIHLYDLNANREMTCYETTVLNAYKHQVIEI